jgi:response regulator NasT
MSKAYRVAIADADPNTLEFLALTLRNLGHDVLSRAPTMKQLRDVTGDVEIDLIVGEAKSEGCLQTLQKWSDTRSIPAILTSRETELASLEKNLAHQIFGVLVKPIREAELAATIVVATQRFHEFEQLRKEANCLRKALDDRKIIERAKGIVMKKCGLDEAEAFKHLQQLSRNHRQQLVDIAQGLLIAESAFGPIGNPAEAGFYQNCDQRST